MLMWQVADAFFHTRDLTFDLGINEYLHSPLFRYPVEFTLLWINLTDFTVYDVLSLSRLLCWELCYGWYTQLIKLIAMERLALYDMLAYKELERIYPESIPSTLPTGVIEENSVNWEKLEKQKNDKFLKTNLGSNAWAISGKYTESGKPILAADPHLREKKNKR